MSVVRAMLGTSANMTSLSLMRDYAVHTLHFADSAAVDTTCAATSGVFTVIAMNPVDITRVCLREERGLSPDFADEVLQSADGKWEGQVVQEWGGLLPQDPAK